MRDARSGPSRRTLLGLALAAGAIAGAVLVDLAVSHNRQRHLEEEATRKAREGAELAREALHVQLQAVVLMTDNAAANPRFLAALRGRVDRATLADLLSTETWWEPYREHLAAISWDGTSVAFSQAERTEGLLVDELMRQAGKERKPVAQPLAGAHGAFLAAARPVALGPGASAVLLLAKRLDGAVVSAVAGRAGKTILISDGRRALASFGAASPTLAALVGRELRGDIALADPAEHASAVAIAPGLWLWSLGRADVAQGAVTDRFRRGAAWAVAIPLALVLGVIALRRSRRQLGAPAPREPELSKNLTRLGLSASQGDTHASLGSSARQLGPLGLPPLPEGQAGARPALGRYILVDRIGEGGMAEVYTAVSFGYGTFRRTFVIKRLRPELHANPTAVDLFIDEANLASTLVHPNIVPIFDFGEAGGSYFLSQEYVVGRDVGKIVRRLRERGEAMLSAEAILQLAHEVLAALEYAHGKRDDAGELEGIVHRDITPENVMISERGEVKLLDFGIMKATHRVSQTESGTVKGSVGFMSPEQARGKNVDHRSDLFSLGLVILHAATGEPAYAGQTFYELLTAAASGPGEAEWARINTLPAPLPALLRRALEVDPARRFQSSAEFRAALAPFAGGAGASELARQLQRLFGAELRAEQERLAAAVARTPRSSTPPMPAVSLAQQIESHHDSDL